MSIRVLLADDEALVRTGLRMILAASDDIEVVGEAVDGLAAVEMCRRLAPDVALLDIRMPVVNGIEAARRIADDPEVRTTVLMLATFDDDELLQQALRAGAAGFLLKSMPSEQLTAAVRIAATGEAMLAPSLVRRLLDDYMARNDPDPLAARRIATLTTREQEVLRLIASGRSNAEIAAQLYVGEGTVKTHVAHILAKLEVRDRVQAVVAAYEGLLVRPGEYKGPA